MFLFTRLVPKLHRRFSSSKLRSIGDSSSSPSPIAADSNSSIADDEDDDHHPSSSNLLRFIDSFSSSDDRRRLENCIIDYHLLKSGGDDLVPRRLSESQWRRLVSMDLQRNRTYYLLYLREMESFKIESMRRKREWREGIDRERTEEDKDGRNEKRIFRQMTKQDWNRYYDWNLAKSILFGPQLIIDMSLIPLLRPIEWSRTGRQLILAHHYNRMHRFPHRFLFTGCDREHESWPRIRAYFVDEVHSKFYESTDEHYLDLFPPERLIYLSPDADRVIDEYDYEKIYIVGALVNKFPRPGLTRRRAKEEGIEMRKLPLDLISFVGRPSLCMYHVVNIMNELHAQTKIKDALEKVLGYIEPGSDARKLRCETLKQRKHAYKSVVDKGLVTDDF